MVMKRLIFSLLLGLALGKDQAKRDLMGDDHIGKKPAITGIPTLNSLF